MNFKNKIAFVLGFSSIICISNIAFSQSWVDDTFEDFADGKLDASGQNIYISHNGEIRAIHRFDLNSDGYIDLLFNSTHNADAYVPATLATVAPGRRLTTTPLAVEGSLSAEVSDLNHDGYVDLVFCPNPSGLQHPRRFVTIIWGGADGWPGYRSNGLLPVNNVKAVKVANLNHDHWPDIVTLNSEAWLPGQPAGNIIRIYWGGLHGFDLAQFQDIGIEKADKMISGDFDVDGAVDVAILAKGNTIKFLWATESDTTSRSANATYKTAKVKIASNNVKLPVAGVLCMATGDSDGDGNMDVFAATDEALYVIRGKGKREWDEIISVPGIGASSITAGDIDGDSSLDLVVARFSLLRAGGGEMLGGSDSVSSYISVLWGDQGAFSPSNRSNLSAAYTVATAISDLDGDHQMDIVCATHQGARNYAAESALFFGMGNREFKRNEEGIPGTGAYHVAIIPPKENRAAHVVISNSRKGNLREEVPLLLYWGSENGFKKENCLKIPFKSGYEGTAADINEDGFVDLIAINSIHSGQINDPNRGVNIFWGSRNGFDFEDRRTVLNEEHASTSNIADLDKDGFLDLVIGFFDRVDKKPTELVVYYGSEAGFELKNRVAIPCGGRSSSPMIGDYDKDGWLDIAVNSFSKDLIRIFWGSREGFNEKQQQAIPLSEAIDLETADLNNDGYLDLIACIYKDDINNHYDTGVIILWGGKDGFMKWNAQWLPGFTPLGPVVADFDDDGFLDLFCPHYHGDITREQLPMYLYWGGKEGFQPRRRTVLTGDSGADGLAADFNRDGKMDLAMASHSIDGAHSKAMSKIYYNDGKRFDSQSMRIQYLPSPGTHWMWNEDMGHIYTRGWVQSYTSSVFSWNKEVREGVTSYEATVPTGSELILKIRKARSEKSLIDTKWQVVKENGFDVGPDDRYLQYKIVFKSGNGDRYPVLDQIKLVLK